MILFVTDQARPWASRHAGPPRQRQAAQHNSEAGRLHGGSDESGGCSSLALDSLRLRPLQERYTQHFPPGWGERRKQGLVRAHEGNSSVRRQAACRAPLSPTRQPAVLPTAGCLLCVLPLPCRGGEPAWPDAPEEEWPVIQVRCCTSVAGPLLLGRALAWGGWSCVVRCAAGHARCLPGPSPPQARALLPTPVLQARLHQVRSIRSNRGAATLRRHSQLCQLAGACMQSALFCTAGSCTPPCRCSPRRPAPTSQLVHVLRRSLLPVDRLPAHPEQRALHTRGEAAAAAGWGERVGSARSTARSPEGAAAAPPRAPCLHSAGGLALHRLLR